MRTPDLSELGMRALKEFAAWDERNRVRKILKEWRWKVGYERGEEVKESDWEPDEWAEYKAIEAAATKAQRQLAIARASTRRCAERLMP